MEGGAPLLTVVVETQSSNTRGVPCAAIRTRGWSGQEVTRANGLAELGLLLEELVRRSARDILRQAIEAEVQVFLDELRDPARVPVEVIAVPNPATDGLAPEDDEVIGEKISYRLAQRPVSYVILQYVRPLISNR